MIGEMDILINSEKRKFCFMTKKGAELLTLSKKEFKRLILVEYREIGKQIFGESLKKMKTFKNNYKNAIAHLKNSSKHHNVSQKDPEEIDASLNEKKHLQVVFFH